MLVTFLEEYHRLVLIVHVLGVALGLGGATISDILFFKFLKNFHISKEEAGTLSMLSKVIWFALVLLVLSGIGLYLPETERLLQSSKFLMKMVVVAVIIVNGTLLNLLISPRLVKISFLRSLRRLAFAMGAISITSWYSAFILGMLRAVPATFGQLLAIYIFLLILAVTISQLTEKVFAKRTQGR